MEFDNLSEEQKDFLREWLDEYINDPKFQIRLMLEVCIREEKKQRTKDLKRLIEEDRELCKNIFEQEFGGLNEKSN